jgi:hypothetical protein
MKVEPWNPDEDGALTDAALKRELEARRFQVTRYVYPQGRTFPTTRTASTRSTPCYRDASG